MEYLLAVRMGGRSSPRRRHWGRALCCLLAVALICAPDLRAAESEEEEAKMRVRGFGFFGNRALMRTLELIADADAPPTHFTATQIEDAAMLLLAQVRQDGYLRPEVEATVKSEDGDTETYIWEQDRLIELPRPMRAKSVRFRIRKGDLYFFETIEFEGLTVVEEERAREYFVATGYLIETRRARMFTPGRLESGLSSLREVLVNDGYERARVAASRVERNDETGQVHVTVSVNEGVRSIIRRARGLIAIDGETQERELEIAANQPYSRTWVQDRAKDLRTEFYERGHPDAEVNGKVENREPADGRVLVDLVFEVNPGPYVEVGEIIFRGNEKTKESILRRRVDLSEGDALNRVEVDAARYRLARLGVFEWVDVEFEEVDGNARDVVFNLREGTELDVNLLFGYGSYEMARVGVEVEQYNIFGRAHRSRLRLAQSLRSSSVNYRYTVPEIFGEEIHGFGTLFALRREEPDFDRREFGSSVGLQTLFYRIDVDAGLRYTYQLLESRAGIASGPDGLDRAIVSAVDLTLQRDLRDNPIYPERGHNMRTILELASEAMGGQVDYQRFELNASYHKEIGRGLFIHAGLTHGLLHTFGEVEEEIPINRRFFTGGESTIRGYLEGEASPRNELGELVGSESYVLLNLELEQALTQRWSVVAFSDSIGIARRFADYPLEDTLYSIGLGIRYKTLVGPIRLEYGHNLNPRSDDPSGAIHLSIGFPF